MAVNLDILLQLPEFDFWSVPVYVTPLASQPGQPAYKARGIYNTYALDVTALDGSFVVNQRDILDIRESEFPVRPLQGDQINIPKDCNGVLLGDFEITKSTSDGGGATTLEIRKLEPAAP